MNQSRNSQWTLFFRRFSEENPAFLHNLSSHYPQLSQAEFKICCYLRAGHCNREIVEMTELSLRSIETTRYRLRKKLPIQSNEDLSVFLMKI